MKTTKLFKRAILLIHTQTVLYRNLKLMGQYKCSLIFEKLETYI